jgi:glycosyltransferase involved in cell wall biosynthesis
MRQLLTAPQVAAALGSEARLHVVGACDAPEVQALGSSSVRLHGRADALAPIFDAARVFVVPTRYAAGIPHKAHEAAAHGLPMVATPLIAAQLGWREELLLADSASDFAAACVRLHGDAVLWQALRERALRAVERDCSPAAFDATVRGIMATIAASPAR